MARSVSYSQDDETAESEKAEGEGEGEGEKRISESMKKKHAERQAARKLDPHLEDQFASGRLFACIASRPGQSGRCDGYASPRLDGVLNLSWIN